MILLTTLFRMALRGNLAGAKKQSVCPCILWPTGVHSLKHSYFLIYHQSLVFIVCAQPRTIPPVGNGMVERLHRTLKAAIRSRKQEWLRSLPVVLLGIRAMPTESGFSSFTAVTGTQLLFPRCAIEKVPVGKRYIRELAKHMSDIYFVSLSRGHHHSRASPMYIPTDLTTCTSCVGAR